MLYIRLERMLPNLVIDINNQIVTLCETLVTIKDFNKHLFKYSYYEKLMDLVDRESISIPILKDIIVLEEIIINTSDTLNIYISINKKGIHKIIVATKHDDYW